VRIYALVVGIFVLFTVVAVSAGRLQPSAATSVGRPAGFHPVAETTRYLVNRESVLTNGGCALSDNTTTAVPYEAYVPNENQHGYRFGVYCLADHYNPDSESYHVVTTSAIYDFPSQTATERDTLVLEGNARITARYHCSADPWSRGDVNDAYPTCSRTSLDVTGSPNLCPDYFYVTSGPYSGFLCDDPIDLPYSVALLSEQSLTTLYAAINKAELAAFAGGPTPPAPTPAATPVISTLGTPTPSGLSGFAGAAEQSLKPVILAPAPNDAVHGTFGVNAVRQSQPQPNDVFDLQWQYQPSGSSTWAIADSDQLQMMLDKSQNPNGVAQQASILAAQAQCQSAPCQWRIRARLHGVTAAPWSDFVQFSVQSP
jgi:hypothetical protein